MRTYFINWFYYSPLEPAPNSVWGDRGMISVEEAKKIIQTNVDVLPAKKVLLADAVGYVLAEDVYSGIDFPPFNQSNVDGYAIAFKDANERLTIHGISAAGNNENIS